MFCNCLEKLSTTPSNSLSWSRLERVERGGERDGRRDGGMEGGGGRYDGGRK